MIALAAAGVGISRSWRSALAILVLPALAVGVSSQWAMMMVWNGPLHPEIGLAGDLLGLIPWTALALVAASWEHVVPGLRRLVPTPAPAATAER